MSENILSPDPTLQPNYTVAHTQSAPPVVPLSVPVPKKSPILLFITLTLLSIVSVFAIYLFLQVRTLTLEATATPTPLPTPMASADPTSGWQTYFSDKHHFSFKYPTSWKLTEDPVGAVTLTHDISSIDVNMDKCESKNDCQLEGKIVISSQVVDSSVSNLCSLFGECLSAKKIENIEKDNVSIQLEYLQESSIYPTFSYIKFPNLIVRAKSYLPSLKNCIGNCDGGEDSTIIKDLGKEISKIISTFKFTDPEKPIMSTCTYNDKIYQEGESLKIDKCNTCSCDNGQVICTLMACE